MSGRIIIGTDGVTRTPRQHAAWIAEREAAAMPAPDALTRMAPPAMPTPFRHDDEPGAPAAVLRLPPAPTTEQRIVAALSARYPGSHVDIATVASDGSVFVDVIVRTARHESEGYASANGTTRDTALKALARIVGVL